MSLNAFRGLSCITSFIIRSGEKTFNPFQDEAEAEAHAHYEQQLQVLKAQLQRGDVSKLMQILKIATKLERIQAQQDAHAQKVNELRAKQYADRSVSRLCADANTIAGTDGANFFTKAGKVFTGETPHDGTDDRTGK